MTIAIVVSIFSMWIAVIIVVNRAHLAGLVILPNVLVNITTILMICSVLSQGAAGLSVLPGRQGGGSSGMIRPIIRV